jgi:hypothetical protein
VVEVKKKALHLGNWQFLREEMILCGEKCILHPEG